MKERLNKRIKLSNLFTSLPLIHSNCYFRMQGKDAKLLPSSTRWILCVFSLLLCLSCGAICYFYPEKTNACQLVLPLTRSCPVPLLLSPLSSLLSPLSKGVRANVITQPTPHTLALQWSGVPKRPHHSVFPWLSVSLVCSTHRGA